MLYFGPIKPLRSYFDSIPGLTSSYNYSNPADLVIRIASDMAKGLSTTNLSLEDVSDLANKNVTALYGSTVTQSSNGPLESSTVQNYNNNEGVWDIIKQNFAADWGDIKKSWIPIQILLEREFLREVRRRPFWTAITLRAIVMSVVIGM